MIEVEVKARVDEAKKVERSIIALGATPIGIENQADTYYNSPHRDFKATDEALRIRVQDAGHFLTYKGPKLDVVSKTRKECEVGFDDVATMGDILSSLGFSPVATIVKKRRKFRLGNFLIVLDEVRDLGTFIEVEVFARDSEAFHEKVESIFKFMEKIGIPRECTVRESYLELMLEKNVRME